MGGRGREGGIKEGGEASRGSEEGGSEEMKLCRDLQHLMMSSLCCRLTRKV